MNKTLLTLSLVGTLGASPAFASDKCEVPEADWQPIETLQAQLEDQGWEIRELKIDDGCYEAYAIDAEGRKVETYFNPATFEVVKSEVED